MAGDSESERSGAEDLESDQEDGEQEGQEGGEATRVHSKSFMFIASIQRVASLQLTWSVSLSVGNVFN